MGEVLYFEINWITSNLNHCIVEPEESNASSCSSMILQVRIGINIFMNESQLHYFVHVQLLLLRHTTGDHYSTERSKISSSSRNKCLEDFPGR
jgi:hypothetical protein